MAGSGQSTQAAEALRRAARIVRAFPIERRMEDEPAHHEKAMERLAEQDERQ